MKKFIYEFKLDLRVSAVISISNSKISLTDYYGKQREISARQQSYSLNQNVLKKAVPENLKRSFDSQVAN